MTLRPRALLLKESRAGVAVIALALVATFVNPSAPAAAGEHRSPGGPASAPWVAYQSSLRGTALGPEGLFLVRPDGADDHEIATSLAGEHMHPDWSSDGRTLAFRADIGDYPQLYVMDPIGDPGGLRAQQLTTCAGACLQVDDPALSPDGRSIAFVEDTGPPVVVGKVEVPRTFALRVAEIGRHGLSHVRTLLRTHTLTELVEPRWSPDSRSLVFWADHTDAETATVDRTAVFTIHVDGTHRRQITPWSMLAGEADWSPDGQELVFVTHPLIVFNFDQVVSNLYTARPDGSQLRQLTHATTPADRATQARWTPAGRIVYTRVTADGRALWLRDATGLHPHPLAPGGRSIRTHGDVQPVGGEGETARNGRIAFARFDPVSNDFSLWVARPDGSDQRRLTQVPSFFSDWSPDGSRLVFDFTEAGNEHIASIRSDGTDQQQLTNGPGIQEVPRYSPDGSQIAFDASAKSPDDPSFATAIWLMRRDGSHPRQLTRGGFDVEPAFSPDGKYLVFGRITGQNGTAQAEAVYVVRTNGTGLRQVVAARPGLEHPRWSPDGRLITFNIAPEADGVRDAGTIYAVHPDAGGLRRLRPATPTWRFTKAVWSPDGRSLLAVCNNVQLHSDNLCLLSPNSGRFHAIVTAPASQPVNFPSWGAEPD